MKEKPFPRDGSVSRRAFVVQVGAAAALLGTRLPAHAQAPTPVPGKDKLIVRSPRPINLETPLRELTADVTPTELFFVRNNYDGPVIDPAAYVLTVDGEVDNPLTLRLDDLKRMEMVTQTITLECAGNGRSFHKPPASGLQWENGAVGTAVWRGVRLADVLRLARPKAPALHVVPDGNDAPPTPQAPDFIRSHPIAKAMEPHTMLALEMNGQPVPHLHGGPVPLAGPRLGRLGVDQVADPAHARRQGVGAARSWRGATGRRASTTRIRRTRSSPSSASRSSWRRPTGRSSPRAPRPSAASRGRAKGPSLPWTCRPTAASPGSRRDSTGAESRYAWRRWELAWTAPAGAYTLMARASDSLGRYQPASRPRDPQGYRWNVIHAIRVNVA